MFRRAALGVIATFLAIPIVLAGSNSVAHADGNLRITTTTTYTVDADTGVVHVVVDASVKNQYGCSGPVTYYYTGFYVPIPIGASPAAATTRDSLLQIASEPIPETDDYLLLDVSFSSRLYCGQTTQVTVTYDLLGNAPRTPNPSRINSAYSSFLAFGIGDDASIRVVIPSSFTSETFGDAVVRTLENGNTIYTAANIADSTTFDFFVSASHNSNLIESEVTTDDGIKFIVLSWPGDTEWQTFVTHEIEIGVPVLEKLIGQPWPIAVPVDVRESHTPYLYGYAGWFSIATNELEIGEDLDADTALHELSHAWFSDKWFSERWLVEGFAQVLASKSVEELGDDGLKPKPIVTSDAGQSQLNEWGDPSFAPISQEIDDVESFGYNASFFVVSQIANDIGDERLREVLDAVANDKTAYRGDGAPEDSAAVTDWRRFLDLVEEIGGSTKAADLFETYVVSSAQHSSLADRSTARDEYHDLVDHGGDWAAPVVVRQRMSVWNFSKATELIAAAQDVLALRDELDTKSAELESTYPTKLETLYESEGENFDESTAELQKQLDTADALLAAVAADAEDDGLFGGIGLIGTDLSKTLADAKAAFAAGNHDEARDLAQEVNNKVNDASSAGKLRTAVAVGGLLLVGLGALLLVRRGRRRKQASADAANTTVAGSDEDGAGTIDGNPVREEELGGGTDAVGEPGG